MEHNSSKLNWLQDFPAISAQEWEDIIIKDLKGADYEKKLIWQPINGLKFKPFYRKEDIENLSFTQSQPCEAPFVRGNKTDNNWVIRQRIEEDEPQKANIKAVDALSKGAESIAFNVINCTNVEQLVCLLRNIDLSKINIHFFGASSYIQLAQNLVKALVELNYDAANFKASFDFDSLGYFLAHGKFYASIDSNFVELDQLFQIIEKELPFVKIININTHRIHNAGGLLTHELAYGLNMAVEYVSRLISKGYTVDQVASKIEFSFAIGANYFLEIAKIRAARLLWASIINAYNPAKELSKYMYVNSITSTWNKTIFDPHVNILRTTTEAMSAAIGGCDTLTVLPFDDMYKNADNLSERIARNMQIILKEEAYFNKIADVSAGSYYIENLTHELAQASWKIFLEVENKGGFIENAQLGHIMENIEQAAQQKLDLLAKRREVLVGTNQYPNFNENMLNKIQPKTSTKHLRGLKDIRLAHQFEALRLGTEDFIKRDNKPPKVLLVPFGNLNMRKARATFSLNFFGCAGYQVYDNNGFNSTDMALNEIDNLQPQIVVLCSSDEEYAEMGIQIIQAVKSNYPEMIIVVAGNPVDAMDNLNKAGVNTYINVKSNVLITLQHFHTLLGIY